jgi:hypothetical protein
MASTRIVMRAIEDGNADPDLVQSLLVSHSDSEAAIAFSLLRGTISDANLVAIANVREVLRVLPGGPFRSGESLEILEKVGGYENTGYSYRRVFESPHGVFGVEFIGESNSCDEIAIHTPAARYTLARPQGEALDSALVPSLIRHGVLLDAILEALELLGSPLDATIYMTPDDFLVEHGAGAARDVFSELF